MARRSKVVLVMLTSLLVARSVQAEPIRLAVIGFEAAAADTTLQGLAKILPYTLMSGFKRYPQVQFVDRENVETILREQRIQGTALAAKSAARVGKLLAADKLITGSIASIGDGLELKVFLYRVSDGQLDFSTAIKSGRKDLSRVCDQMADELVKALTRPTTTDATESAADTQPTANRDFMHGLTRYQAGLFDEALADFLSALSKHVGHAEARFWAGKTYAHERECDHALLELGEFLRRFPQHKLADEAKSLMAACK